METTMNVTVNLGSLKDPTLDMTDQMLIAADLIAQEMRGNVKAGLDVNDISLRPNKSPYAERKMAAIGHAKPLIGKYQTLVTPSFYKIKKMGRNFVRINLMGQHPGSNLSVAEIGYIHNYGLGNNPKREFAGITKIAVKRVMALLGDWIARKIK